MEASHAPGNANRRDGIKFWDHIFITYHRTEKKRRCHRCSNTHHNWKERQTSHHYWVKGGNSKKTTNTVCFLRKVSWQRPPDTGTHYSNQFYDDIYSPHFAVAANAREHKKKGERKIIIMIIFPLSRCVSLAFKPGAPSLRIFRAIRWGLGPGAPGLS